MASLTFLGKVYSSRHTRRTMTLSLSNKQETPNLLHCIQLQFLIEYVIINKLSAINQLLKLIKIEVVFTISTITDNFNYYIWTTWEIWRQITNLVEKFKFVYSKTVFLTVTDIPVLFNY